MTSTRQRPGHVPTYAAAAASLEEHLGDPFDPGSAMSHAAALEADERADYPHPAVSLLVQWGAHDWFVPAELGGCAVDVEDGGNLMRLVARRDITVATALSINAIAYTAVWAGGDTSQRERLADRLRSGSRMCWALTERDHGSDLLAGETRARRHPDGGWVVDGEKWLIGNATLSEVVLLLARTSDRPGPAAYSLFAVDRLTCPAGTVEELPNNPPLGLRGFDLSGLRFDGCRVPDDALVGGEGRGLELVLTTSQMARTNLTFLALGALDTGLRLTMDFAREREIFGSTVWDIPYSRTQLVECFADLLVGDALSTAAVRALQLAPDQTASWSSIAKYFVPTVVDEAMTRAAVVLGARHYLRTGPWAIFQKMARDLIVTDFADGNTVVNLKNVVARLEAPAADGVDDAERSAAIDRVAAVFGLAPDLPSYDPRSCALFSRRPDDVVVALPDTVAALRERGGGWESVADLGERVLAALARLRDRTASVRERYGTGRAEAAETFALAKEYCALVAAAAYLHLQHHGARTIDPRLARPEVAVVVVTRQLRRCEDGPPAPDATDVEVVARALESMHSSGSLFSHRQVDLAGGARTGKERAA